MTEHSLPQVLPQFKINTPRIYVACLSAYSNGYLHGRWIDVVDDVDAMQNSINAILESSPIDDAEEWAIHGHSGFGTCALSESAPLEDVIAYAAFLEEHGEDLGSAVLGFYHDLENAKRCFEEFYCGEYKSEADFVEQTAQDIYTIPDELEYYIDYALMARDWFINDYFSIDLGCQHVHIFHYF